MTQCKHQRAVRLPLFPSDAMFCGDCGDELPRPGYDEHGVRDYYLSGDSYWRRRSEAVKAQWAAGKNVSVVQCTVCCFVGDIDDFDVMGADEGCLFCPSCGVEFEPIDGEVFGTAYSKRIHDA